MVRFFHGFWKDQSGAAGYLGVVALVPLLVTMFYVANSSKAIHDRTRNQDAADMIALMHASEGARALNTLSMNQVTMSQVFATGVTSGSLIPIAHTQALMGGITILASNGYQYNKCNQRYQALKAVPFVGMKLYLAAMAGCQAPAVATATQIGTNIFEVEKLLFDYDVYDALETSSNAIEALNAANDALYDRFPQSVAVQARQIAEEMNATDIYFDDHCADPGGAGPVRSGSCDDGNPHQGMNLPVVKNLRVDAYARFCLALHNGTGGMNIPIPIPGLGSGGATLINGSYVKRGFDFNQGPLGGGGSEENPHLRDHVSDETGMGALMEEYYDILTRKTLFDGLINFAATASLTAESIADAAGLAIDDERVTDAQDKLAEVTDAIPKLATWETTPQEAGGMNWPREQTEEDNEYKTLVDIRVANQCTGDFLSDLFGPMLSVLPASLTGALPPVDVWHPAYDGMGLAPTLPAIQPTPEDYSDHFKILAYSQRIANDRWAPQVFENPTQSFFASSQAIIYNSDEIGLYSQNWRAVLMPTSKLEDSGRQVADRMTNEAHGDFTDLAERLGPTVDQDGWGDVAVR